MQRRAWLLLLIVTALALTLRIYRLDEVPPGFFRDEAAIGVDAQSVAETGKDIHGARYPVLFRALDDWKHPLYVYGAVASVRALGPTKLAVRLPAAVFGAATVFLLALLALELTRDPRVAIASALFLAVTPWHVQYSRMAWESVTLGFSIVLALFLFFRARRLGGSWRHALAGAAFGLALYSYTAAKLLVPAFLVALAAIEKRDAKWIRFVADRVRRQAEKAPAPPIPIAPSEPPVPVPAVSRRDGVFLAVAFLLVVAPMIWVQAEHWDDIQTRFRAVSVFREENPLLAAWRSYVAHLSPRFLFLEGDANARQGLPGFGGLLVATAPLCAIGLLRAFARMEPEDLILVAWTAIYPLGATLTSEGIPHASRSFLAVPLFALLAGSGLALVLDRLEGTRSRAVAATVVLALALGNAGVALRSYFLEYPGIPAVVSAWDGGVQELTRALEAKRAELARVHFAHDLDPRITRAHILFFRGFDPRTFDPEKPDPYYAWSQEKNVPRFFSTLRRDEAVVARLDQLPGLAPTWAVSDPTGAVVFGIYRGVGR